MTTAQREELVRKYVDAYNRCDVNGMITDLEDEIIFQNIAGGEVNMRLEGLEQFKQQAEQAVFLFSSRRQTIEAMNHGEKDTTIQIDYEATLAIDLPNGFKKGEKIKMAGKSVFTFSENKIAGITDIS